MSHSNYRKTRRQNPLPDDLEEGGFEAKVGAAAIRLQAGQTEEEVEADLVLNHGVDGPMAMLITRAARVLLSEWEPKSERDTKPDMRVAAATPAPVRAGRGSRVLLGPTDDQVLQAIDSHAGAFVDMAPVDFLRLTTLDEDHIRKVQSEAHDLAKYEKHMESGKCEVHPFLRIDVKSGQVVGHDGRHRAAAILSADPDAQMRVALIPVPLSKTASMADIPETIKGEYDPGFRLKIRKNVTVVDANVQQGCAGCGKPAPTEPKEKKAVFQDTVLRRDAKGQLFLMNRPEKGWSSYGIPYPSEQAVLDEWDVTIGPWTSDKHSAFAPVKKNRKENPARKAPRAVDMANGREPLDTAPEPSKSDAPVNEDRWGESNSGSSAITGESAYLLGIQGFRRGTAADTEIARQYLMRVGHGRTPRMLYSGHSATPELVEGQVVRLPLTALTEDESFARSFASGPSATVYRFERGIPGFKYSDLEWLTAGDFSVVRVLRARDPFWKTPLTIATLRGAKEGVGRNENPAREPLVSYRNNETGMESYVVYGKRSGVYNVTMRDLDSGEWVPGARIGIASLDEAKALAQKWAGVRMENPIMTARHIGFCPVCSRRIKVRDDKLVHHGYQRPGYGYIVGDCFAVGMTPHELSPDTAQKYLDVVVTRSLAEAHKMAEHYGPSNEPEKLSFRVIADESQPVVYRYGQDAREKTDRLMTRDELKVYVSRNPPHHIASLGSDIKDKGWAAREAAHRWDSALAEARRLAKSELNAWSSEQARVSSLISTWTLQPLQTVEEEVAAKRASATERDAKKKASVEAKTKEVVDKARARVDSAVKNRNVSALMDIFRNAPRTIRNTAYSAMRITRGEALKMIERDSLGSLENMRVCAPASRVARNVWAAFGLIDKDGSYVGLDDGDSRAIYDALRPWTESYDGPPVAHWPSALGGGKTKRPI